MVERKLSPKNKKLITQKEFNKAMDYVVSLPKLSRVQRIEKGTKIATKMVIKRTLRKKDRRRLGFMDIEELVLKCGENILFDEKKKRKDPFWKNVAERTIGGIGSTVGSGVITYHLLKRDRLPKIK